MYTEQPRLYVVHVMFVRIYGHGGRNRRLCLAGSAAHHTVHRLRFSLSGNCSVHGSRHAAAFSRLQGPRLAAAFSCLHRPRHVQTRVKTSRGQAVATTTTTSHVSNTSVTASCAIYRTVVATATNATTNANANANDDVYNLRINGIVRIGK